MRLFFIIPALLWAMPQQAQNINWANDVAPILYKHCVQCHRDGSIGGFSLLDYQSAFTMREEIVNAVSSRRMPPWKANPEYRHYAGENYLSAAQIQTIEQWVANNAPAGNLADAPAPPQFPVGSAIGIPDMVLQTPAYTMSATSDEYRCFVISSELTETVFLRGLEVIPGNHMAVHHVLIYEDVTGQGKLLDEQTPEPGYVNFGGPGVQGARLIGAWVPGARNSLLPPFMGIKLTAGADLIVQVHFPGSATGLTDQSALNLFFTPTNQGIREVSISPLLYHYPPSLQNGPLYIPAGTIKTFQERFTVPQAGSIIAVAPHMHLIGRSIKCFGVTLAGDTIPLIHIPEWDFHWQGNYTFQHIQKLPAGTKVYANAVYDNTENNPFNPSSPPEDVSGGEATTDEMMLVYFIYTAYQPGDENIVLDSTLLTTSTHFAAAEPIVSSLSAYPNPVTDFTDIQFELSAVSDATIQLVSIEGKVCATFPVGDHLPPGAYTRRLEMAALPPGTWSVVLTNRNGQQKAVSVIKK